MRLMSAGTLGQAAGLFAVTKIDDILVLALGQYLGFIAILAVAIATSVGATFLPEGAIPDARPARPGPRWRNRGGTHRSRGWPLRARGTPLGGPQ
jgi:cadmium resistance protein CadD (predicted permease)